MNVVYNEFCIRENVIRIIVVFVICNGGRGYHMTSGFIGLLDLVVLPGNQGLLKHLALSLPRKSLVRHC